jgi:hypothetical protein
VIFDIWNFLFSFTAQLLKYVISTYEFAESFELDPHPASCVLPPPPNLFFKGIVSPVFGWLARLKRGATGGLLIFLMLPQSQMQIKVLREGKN